MHPGAREEESSPLAEGTFLFRKLTHAALTTATSRQPETPEEIQSEISGWMKDSSTLTEKENISLQLI